MKRSFFLAIIWSIPAIFLSLFVLYNVIASEPPKEPLLLKAPKWLPGSPSITDTKDGVVLHAQWTPVKGARAYKVYIDDWVTGMTAETNFDERKMLGNGEYEIRVEAIYDPGIAGVMSSPGFIKITTEPHLRTREVSNRLRRQNEKRRKWAPIRYGAYFGAVFFVWGFILSLINIKSRQSRILAITLPYPILILVFFKPLFIYGPILAFLTITTYVPLGIIASLLGFRVASIAKRYNTAA